MNDRSDFYGFDLIKLVNLIIDFFYFFLHGFKSIIFTI